MQTCASLPVAGGSPSARANLRPSALREKQQPCSPVPASQLSSGVGVREAPFVAPGLLPKSAEGYPFEDARGQSHCWHLGRETAAAFCARSRIVGTEDKLFNSKRVKIFFPIGEEYFAVRTVTLRGAAITSRVLCAVEQSAVAATAYHMRKHLGVEAPAAEDIRGRLEGATVCHLMCKRVGGGNHVYVRLS